MTAEELFQHVLEENFPIDWGWIEHIKRTYTTKEKMDWCRNNIEYCAPSGTSKNMIGRASTKLYYYLF